jgi:hypothetical protein
MTLAYYAGVIITKTNQGNFLMNKDAPLFPTHAVKYIDNSCEESEEAIVLAYRLDGVFYDFPTDEPLVEYDGDEILRVWDLCESRSDVYKD